MKRSQWPTARCIQNAADQLRDAAPDITDGRFAGLAEPVADWLDATANALAWLAPYHEHEPGYPLWETATRVAHKTIGGDPVNCPDCHPKRTQR